MVSCARARVARAAARTPRLVMFITATSLGVIGAIGAGAQVIRIVLCRTRTTQHRTGGADKCTRASAMMQHTTGDQPPYTAAFSNLPQISKIKPKSGKVPDYFIN